ncbi:hypothetical protein [Salinibacter ruber]|uniref:hypothetical protein n=1 Tax=Salinibacter ruber TaxID=146919 RepID=UPI00216A601C|nr:hypothetical protein [Salinibacter ruber]MCS4051264.1 hypothetical protein [Salinibacter ruber]
MSTTNVNEQDINEQDIKDAAGALMHNDTSIRHPITSVVRKNTKWIARRWVGGDIGEMTLARFDYAEDMLLITDLGIDQIHVEQTELLRAMLCNLMYDPDTGKPVDFEIVDEEEWEEVTEFAA